MTTDPLPDTKSAEDDAGLVTNRERLYTDALTKSKSPVVWQAHVARHLEYRLERAEERAENAEKAAATHAVTIARLQEQVGAVNRFTAPSVAFQAGSVLLAGLGGYYISKCPSAGMVLLFAAAIFYAMGTWLQKRILPADAGSSGEKVK